MRTFERLLFISVRLSAIFLPILTVGGIALGGIYCFVGLAIVFGYYFLVEVALWVSGLGITSRASDEFLYVDPKKPTWLDRHGVAVYGVLQMILFPIAIVLLGKTGHSPGELVGGVLSLGVMAGSVGGLAGHEYIHRRNKWEKYLGIAIYGTLNYAHFTISHIYGHHRSVGLRHDWSTSRKNESSFRFLWRALVHGYFGAWRLEAERLRRSGRKAFSLTNFMIKASTLQMSLAAFLYLAFGSLTLEIYVVTSLLSVSLMEMVNYLSHYGMNREVRGDGRPVPVNNHHSWESDNKVTNWFIFNAGKHCHHHRSPSDAHHSLVLAHANEPLPFGLPLMTLIAFCPPLYFKMMNPLLERSTLKLRRPSVSPIGARAAGTKATGAPKP